MTPRNEASREAPLPVGPRTHEVKAGTTAHKQWKCPECGRKYTNPVPAFGVDCPPHPKHKDFRRAVAMVAVDPPINLNTGRRSVA